MAKPCIIILALVLCMMLVTPEAQRLSCNTVVQSLEPCMSYLKQGGALPAGCCDGVRSLNSAANTPEKRQQACNCLKSAAKAYGVNANNASGLPKACAVNLGFPISYATDCTTVS